MKILKNTDSIIVVDDHCMFRQVIKQLLIDTNPQNMIFEAHSGENALRLLSHHVINIAILDINMPGMNGLVLAQHIRTFFPETKVIMLTSYNEKEVVIHAKQVGAKGFIVKDDAGNDLQDCVNCVSNGSSYVSKSISQYAFLF